MKPHHIVRYLGFDFFEGDFLTKSGRQAAVAHHHHHEGGTRMRQRSERDRSARKKELLTLADDGLARLAVELASAHTTDAMKAWLKFLGRFTKYSVQNQQLIWCQRPNATLCNGYQAWTKLGRQVMKGEKGISILAPLLFRKEIEVENSDASCRNTEIATGMAFKVVTVFDVAQTDGDELPIHPATNTTEVSASVLRRVRRGIGTLCPVIDDQPADVRRGHLGWTDGKTIHVTAGQTTGAQLSVLVHEAAHFLLHFDDDHRVRGSSDLRNFEELEAEATACAVTSALGYEFSSFSAAYLSDYKATPATLRRSLPRIQEASRTILAAIERNGLCPAK